MFSFYVAIILDSRPGRSSSCTIWLFRETLRGVYSSTQWVLLFLSCTHRVSVTVTALLGVP